jgi:hypothetical protein
VRLVDVELGHEAELGEGEFFNWLITHPDGRREGAIVDELLARIFDPHPA